MGLWQHWEAALDSTHHDSANATYFFTSDLPATDRTVLHWVRDRTLTASGSGEGARLRFIYPGHRPSPQGRRSP